MEESIKEDMKRQDKILDKTSLSYSSHKNQIKLCKSLGSNEK